MQLDDVRVSATLAESCDFAAKLAERVTSEATRCVREVFSRRNQPLVDYARRQRELRRVILEELDWYESRASQRRAEINDGVDFFEGEAVGGLAPAMDHVKISRRNTVSGWLPHGVEAAGVVRDLKQASNRMDWIEREAGGALARELSRCDGHPKMLRKIVERLDDYAEQCLARVAHHLGPLD